MIRLKTKLALFNLLSKLVFTALFLIFLPWIIERINLRQVDRDLIQKREQVIGLISKIGIEPFMTSDTAGAFGSYNILKEEFISLERIDIKVDLNYIEITNRLIEDEEISYRVLNYTFTADGQKYLLEIGKSLTSILTARRYIYKVIIIFLILIIIVTFLTDLQYNRVLLHPLAKITDKLKGISDPSSFDMTPIDTTTSDFYKLDQALRDLMKNIGELFEKEKEITDNVSHELLTPVSVLRSKLENLLIREDIEPGIANKIEESLRTLHRLQVLVNSLLLIARIESRQYLRDDDIFINDVLKEIANEINPVAEDKGIELKEEFEQDFQFMKANRSLVFSMFFNVINNAVKNTSQGGIVIIRSRFLYNRFNVIISDNGKGMLKEHIDTLFSRFKTKMNVNEDGTGIGLAIAKTIADFHEIVISVTSEVGKGTSFSFLFPENS
jgi:signal transduction histidine kinase